MYNVNFSKRAIKYILKQDKSTQNRLYDASDKLKVNPKNQYGVVKLEGYDDLYRLRMGKFRIVYEVKDNILTVHVIDIDSRGDIYKRL